MPETLVKCICAFCGTDTNIKLGYYNAALKRNGGKVFCCREHFFESRRDNKTIEQRKKEKAEYDREFREKNRERLKKEKHEHYKKTYDPVKAAAHRQTRMPYHVEYCRQPEYKAKKVEYDKMHRAKQNFGEFAEAFLISQQIFELIDNREVKQLNGLTAKNKKRKRAWLRTKKQNLPPLP